MNFQEEIQKLKEKIESKEFPKVLQTIKESLEKAEPAPEDKDALLAELVSAEEAHKAFLAGIEAENEKLYPELKADAEALVPVAGEEGFAEKAKAVQARLKATRFFPAERRAEITAILDQAWKNYNAAREERKRVSEEKQRTCIQELMGVDISAAPSETEELTFDVKKTYSEQIRFAREKLKQIGQTLKTDNAILPSDKREVFERMDKIRAQAKKLEETVFGSFSKRAEELYEIAKNAVENMNVNKAIEPFKEAQRELNILWISKEEREQYRDKFEELYSRIRAKRDENKNRHKEWQDKQKNGMERLQQARDRAADALKRVQQNLEDNRKRLEGSHSEEFTLRVEGWIREGEEKEKDIQQSVDELDKKIRDIQRHLKKSME